MNILQFILEKLEKLHLHYVVLNILFIVILPSLCIFTIDKIIGVFLMLLSRKIIIDWQNKRISINDNERNHND